MKSIINLRILSISAICIVAATFSSCINNNKKATGSTSNITVDANGWKTIDTTAYSISMPNGWTRHDGAATAQYTALYLMAPPDDNFNPNLNVLYQNVGSTTIDDYVKQNYTQMKAMNIEIDTTGDVTTGDLKGKYFMSKFMMKGQIVAVKSYFFIHNGIAYVLTGASKPEKTAKYYPIFDKIVSTFKLKGN